MYKQFASILLVAIISGFLGGALSVWFLMPPSVLAQGGPQKVIEAQEFRVVDDEGRVRATLGFNRYLAVNETRLRLFDRRGIERLSLAAQESLGSYLQLKDKAGHIRVGVLNSDILDSGPELNLFDEEGKVLWSAP